MGVVRKYGVRIAVKHFAGRVQPAVGPQPGEQAQEAIAVTVDGIPQDGELIELLVVVGSGLPPCGIGWWWRYSVIG
jgi:hypothetical protein